MERSSSSWTRMEANSSMEAASAAPGRSPSHEVDPWTSDMVSSQGPKVRDHKVEALYTFYAPCNMHVETWLEDFRKLPADIAMSLAEIARACEQNPKDLPPKQDPTLSSITSHAWTEMACEHLRSTGKDHPSAHLLEAIAEGGVGAFMRAHPNFDNKDAYEGDCSHPVCACKNNELHVLHELEGLEENAYRKLSALQSEQRLHSESSAADRGTRPSDTENVSDMVQASGCRDASRKRKRQSFEDDVRNGSQAHSSRKRSVKSSKAGASKACASSKDSARTAPICSIPDAKQNETASQACAQKALRDKKTCVTEGEEEVLMGKENTFSNPASCGQSANSVSSNRLENVERQGHKVRKNSKRYSTSPTRAQSETMVKHKGPEADHPVTAVDSARELQPGSSTPEVARVTEEYAQNETDRIDVTNGKNTASVLPGGGENRAEGSAANIKKKRLRGHIVDQPPCADPKSIPHTDPDAGHGWNTGGRRASRHQPSQEEEQARMPRSGGSPTLTGNQEPPTTPERWERSRVKPLITPLGDARKSEKPPVHGAAHKLCQTQSNTGAHPIQQLALALTPQKDAPNRPRALTVWPETVRGPLAEAAAGFVNGAPGNARRRRVIKPALVESFFESEASYLEICKGLRKWGVRFSDAELANTMLECAQSLSWAVPNDQRQIVTQAAAPSERDVPVVELNTLAKESSHSNIHGQCPSKVPLTAEDSDTPLSSPPATPHNVEIEIDNNHADSSQASGPRSKSDEGPNPDDSGLTSATSDSDHDEWHESEHEADTEEPMKKQRKFSRTSRRRTGLVSNHFNNSTPPKQSRAPAGVCCKPFPPISESRFGIIQEKLADDPFGLFICVQFLNKTAGRAAVPTYYKLKERYPNAAELAAATHEDVVEMIRHLGLQSQRAKRLIAIARAWTECPPVKGRRYRTKDYPLPGDGKDIKKDEVIDDADERRGAWEIAHLPGAGPYAIDSWRMFCRDRLRGVAQGYRGEGADEDFEPEWKRTLPKDKELKACMRWMWLKEGFDWNPQTGEKTPASAELMEQATRGGIVWQDLEALAKQKVGAGENEDSVDLSQMKEDMLQEKGAREMGDSNVVEMVLPGSTPRTRKATKATNEAEVGKASDKVHVQKENAPVQTNGSGQIDETPIIGTEAPSARERKSKGTKRKSAPEVGETENKSNASIKKGKSAQRRGANGTNEFVDMVGSSATARTSKRAKRSACEDAVSPEEGGKPTNKRKKKSE